MNGSAPVFSVVIASHGRAPLLARLLQSLAQARSADDAEAEILVVDSTAAADRPQIREACANTGAALIDGPLCVRRKRNLGAASARGTWLVFIDSDCEASLEFFRAYRRAFEADPGLRVAAGPTVFRDAETRFTRLIAASSLFAPFRLPAAAPDILLWATTSNLLVRRDVFEAIGGFREDYPFRLGGDDTDLCLRLRDLGHCVAATPAAVCFHSWKTWSSPASVVRRSFRWGWMSARLLRDHPRYRRLDAPGLPAHALACLALAATGAMAGAWPLLLLPPVFVLLAVLLHAVLAAAQVPDRRAALLEDLALGMVELPFGFGRALGSLASGSLTGVLYRLDVDDQAMDAGFPETVRSLWCDHLSFLVAAGIFGWVA